jgi:hypothetical protein
MWPLTVGYVAPMAANDQPPTFAHELTELLFSHRPPITPTTLFSGFVPYRRDQIEAFFTASARALA